MKIDLSEFSKVKILVIGDIMLDRYWHGLTRRISPEAPVPIVEIDNIEEKPGGAANVAMNIRALGAQSYLIGFTGVDDASKIIDIELKKAKVNSDLIKLEQYSTIIKLRVISHSQQLIRLDFEKKIKNINSDLILKKINKILPICNAIIFSDYNKGALNNLNFIINKAREYKIPILVDPKGNDFSKYHGATILTPNIGEFEAIVGKCYNNKQLIYNGMKLINDFEWSALLITQSENGMTLLQPEKKVLHFPSQAKEVFDVTGAGDTVISVLAASLSTGKSLEKSCLLANIAAGISVGKLGTSTVNKKDIETYFSCLKKNNFGIVNKKQLIKEIIKSKNIGEKIVMTNGCFDILHAGHITYLNNARKLGDKLVVAVNSDLSVKKLKGSNRPINSLINRMMVLGALESVDWVISFDEESPKQLISEILPDILVKGGDYKSLTDIVGSTEVWNNGGDVYLLNLEDGISTTNIINNLNL